MHERYDERTLDTIKRCYEIGDYDNCLGLFSAYDRDNKLKVVNYKHLMNAKRREMALYCRRARPDISLAANAREKLAEYIRGEGDAREPSWVANTRQQLRQIEDKLSQGKLIRIQDRGASWHFNSRKTASQHLIQQCQKARRGDRVGREH